MNDLESGLREEFAREAAAVPALPRDLWLRIVEGSGGASPAWLKMAPLAVALAFVLVAGTFLVRSQRPGPAGHSAVGGGAVATASPRPGPAVKPSVSAHPAPTTSADAFGCGAAPSGGASTAGGNLVAVRVAHQDGFDRVTFEFAGSGIPTYSITQQPGTGFTQDPSGKTIDLQGLAGTRVVFHNSSGVGSFTGNNDIKLTPQPRASVNEVRQLGDFERVMSWGLGLNVKPACLRILQLATPARLVIDVQDNS